MSRTNRHYRASGVAVQPRNGYLRAQLIAQLDSQLLEMSGNETDENRSGRLWGILRSTMHDLSVKDIRRVAGAAGFDVSQLSANAEAASGFGSKAEVLNGLDAIFRVMQPDVRAVVLPALANRLREEARTADKTATLLAEQGFRLDLGSSERRHTEWPVGGIASPSRTEERTVSRIRVFISHTAHDLAVATALVDVLRAALPVAPNEIRCTSVDGHRLPGGADTDDQLRQEIRDADVFIGMVSRASLASYYVLFELGARWGAERPLVPVMAAGVTPSDLPPPLARLNALRLDVDAQVHQLLDEAAASLGTPLNRPQTYQRQLETLVAAASQTPTVDAARAVGAARLNALSADGLALLTEAVLSPQGDIMASESQQGLSVGTNGKLFCEAANGREEARWRSAIDELVKAGLIERRTRGSSLLHVTTHGFAEADRLRD